MPQLKKYILLLLCMTAAVQLNAQDTSKPAPKAWLGVLTLTPKYKIAKNWSKSDEAIVSEHFKRLVKNKEAGIVVLAGRTGYADNHKDMFGLVIFYAAGEKAARQFMMDDPAVKTNIMLAKVHPYGIAISKCE